MSHQLGGASESLLADTSNPSCPDLDPMMEDDIDGFAGYDKTDYVPSKRLPVVNNGEETHHQSQSHSVTVGEVDKPERYAEDYPADVSCILRKSQTVFKALKDTFDQNGVTPWAPFKDEAEWELARFLIKEVSQTATDKFLKLSIVSGRPL